MKGIIVLFITGVFHLRAEMSDTCLEGRSGIVSSKKNRAPCQHARRTNGGLRAYGFRKDRPAPFKKKKMQCVSRGLPHPREDLCVGWPESDSCSLITRSGRKESASDSRPHSRLTLIGYRAGVHQWTHGRRVRAKGSPTASTKDLVQLLERRSCGAQRHTFIRFWLFCHHQMSK